MNSYRPTVYGTQHAVSAGHYLATMAGFSVLEAGGNAIDAGCAAGMALGVLQPDLVNVAGGRADRDPAGGWDGGDDCRAGPLAAVVAARPVHA